MAGHTDRVGFFVGEVLERTARRFPNKRSLIAGGSEMTFSEVAEGVARLAAHLQGEGVRQGDRVGLLLPNSLAFALCYYATQMIGAVTTIMDARLKGKELERVLRDADLALLVTHGRLMPEIAQAVAGFQPLRLWVVDGQGDQGFEKRLSSTPSTRLIRPGLRAEDDAVILYTSGTTGEPKGVVLDHVNLAQFPHTAAEVWKTSADSVWGCILPMSHISGPIYCNEIIDKGSTMVIFDQINPVSILEGFEKHRVTFFHGVPPMFGLLLGVRNLKDYDTSSLQLAGMMGMTVPLALMKAFKAAQPHVKVIQGYGLTETSPLITATPGQDADAKLASIGRAVPGVEVRIVDPTGKEVDEGEIITSGPHVMKGYFRRPAATAERIRDGWLHTGDIGRRDDDGYYYHLGRKDDMILTGGLNVYPAEVENLLCEYPQVHEAAVFPISDPERGSLIGAAVVPRGGATLTEKDLLAYLRSNLASFKVPQRIVIRDSLPKTSTGKVIRDAAALGLRR